LAACMKHGFRWVDELAKDEFRSAAKRFLITRVMIGALKRAVRPHLKSMEQGIAPLPPQEQFFVKYKDRGEVGQ